MATLTERALSFAEVQGYVVECASRLFEAYGMPVRHVVGADGAEIKGPAVMAIVGYVSESVCGAVLLLTSREVVARLVPPEVRRCDLESEAVLRDVLGEFANMLAGRVKNQLVVRDVAPLLTPPTTVFGDDLELPAPKSGMSAWHRFAAPGGDVFVRFDASFEADFELGAADATKAPPVREGEMLLWEETP